MCLWARGPGLSARAVDAIVQMFSCFCCCTKDSVGFVFATILCVLRHTFAQLIHRLQLTPMIAAPPLCRRGVAEKVLVHAVSVAAGRLLVIFGHSRHDVCNVTHEPHARSCIFIVLVHLAMGGTRSLHAAGWNQQLRILRASGAVLPTHGAGEALQHTCG